MFIPIGRADVPNRTLYSSARIAGDFDFATLNTNRTVRLDDGTEVGRLTEVVLADGDVDIVVKFNDTRAWAAVREAMYVGFRADSGGLCLVDSLTVAKSGLGALRKLSVCDFERYEITPLQKRRHDLLEKQIAFLEEQNAMAEGLLAVLEKMLGQLDDGGMASLKSISESLKRIEENDRNRRWPADPPINDDSNPQLAQFRALARGERP
jgi:hypothetical protein